MSMPLKVGITGGIGSGKSLITQIFSTLEIPIWDADAEAKKLMNENVEMKSSLIQTFGEKVFLQGKLDRKYLAAIVFNDAFQLEKLNAIVHPLTMKASDEWMATQQTPYAIKEAALFFESGTAAGLDFIIGVYAPETIRLQRAMHRDQADRESIKKRMSYQIDEELKMKLCDVVIFNDEQHMVLPQVLEIHKKLLKIANN